PDARKASQEGPFPWWGRASPAGLSKCDSNSSIRETEMAADTSLIDLVERYGDEDRAREYLESLRWPHGTVCPKCGVEGESYRLNRSAGSSTGEELWKWRA